MDEYQKRSLWRERLTGASYDTGFNLCFQLIEAPAAESDKWQIDFLVSSKKDHSYKVALADYWHRDVGSKKEILKHLGTDFEKQLLLNLGYAARIYPKVWDGLETDKPEGLKVNLDEAFGFLNEAAWILEDAGYKIIIPSWWTPAGRSLYEAVVKDVSDQIENTEGIQRKGLILSTLLKLKQICNHPAQFLHDASEFSEKRSHKLKRLTEMMEEVIDNEESSRGSRHHPH